MFEASLVESQLRRRSPLRTSARCAAIVSFAAQSLLVLLLVALPLLHPDTLPLRAFSMLALPPLPPPAPPIAMRPAAAAAPRSLATLGDTLRTPTRIPSRIDLSPSPAAPIGQFSPMGAADGYQGLSSIVGWSGHGPAIVAAPAPVFHGPVRISQGVAQGLLLTRILPIYPPIAKAAHVQGTVVVEATISTNGAIENARAVSGPAMLQPAALAAVLAARYRPFQLNGRAVAVQTTITIVFTMAS